METDRSFEITLLEIEEENIKLIEEFYLARMRPRDIEELFAQEAQQAPEAALQEEAYGV